MQTSKKAPGRVRSHDSKTASATKTRKKPPARTHRYEPEMIRDFLTQLRCELQNDQFEHAKPGAANEQADAQLEPLRKKYGTRLLYKVGFEDVTEDQRAEINQTMASARQKQLSALDILLETAFKEALAAASQKSKVGTEKSITFSAEDWLKWTRNGAS